MREGGRDCAEEEMIEEGDWSVWYIAGELS